MKVAVCVWWIHKRTEMPPHVPAKMSLASFTIPVLGEEGGAVPVETSRMRFGQNDNKVTDKVTRVDILDQLLPCCAGHVEKHEKVL